MAELAETKCQLEKELREKIELQNHVKHLKKEMQLKEFMHQKLAEWQLQVSSTQTNLSSQEESRLNQETNVYYSSQESHNETLNESSENQIRNLEALLKQERERNNLALNAKDDKLKKLRHDMEKHIQEYQDCLDKESEGYRKSFDVEENIVNFPDEGSRKRTASEIEEVTHTAKNDIQIEQDNDGKYIIIQNKGSTDVNLNGWRLIRKVEDKETTYMFESATVIKPNTQLRVWSSDTEVIQNFDFIMKGQKWPTSDMSSSVLLNDKDEVMANIDSPNQEQDLAQGEQQRRKRSRKKCFIM